MNRLIIYDCVANMASMLMLVFFYSPWFVGWPPLVCLAYRHTYKIAHSFWQPYFITYGDTKCLTKKVAIFGCVQALYGGTLLVSDRINFSNIKHNI